MSRPRVLISAYACYPSLGVRGGDPDERHLSGGESLLGWNLVQQIARFSDVTVLTDSRNRRGLEIARPKLDSAFLHFHPLHLPVRWRRFWHNALIKHLYYFFWQIKAATVAARLHRQRPFDLFHHLTYANDWIPSFIGAHVPIPFVWGPIGGGQRNPPGFMREYPWSARVAERGRVLAQGLGRTLIPSRRQCAARARAILVCNAETKAKFPSVDKFKIHDFPVTGVASEDLLELTAGPPPADVFRVLSSGRLIPYKRFDLSIRAFARFVQEDPGRNTELEIIGEGPDRLALEQTAARLGITARVHFSSWLPRHEVVRRMCQSDVFLFPSLREGGGIVIVEAMACGKPAVVLDTAGPGFLIQEPWGIKIAPRSSGYVIEEMARALRRLADDPALRQRLGRAARTRVEEYFVWDRLGDRLRAIYEGVLA